MPVPPARRPGVRANSGALSRGDSTASRRRPPAEPGHHGGGRVAHLARGDRPPPGRREVVPLAIASSMHSGGKTAANARPVTVASGEISVPIRIATCSGWLASTMRTMVVPKLPQTASAAAWPVCAARSSATGGAARVRSSRCMQVRPSCSGASSSAPAWLDTRADAREFAAGGVVAPPDLLRWNPFALPTEPTDFVAGLHNGMVSHGPEAEAFERASNAKLAPHEFEDTLAFMLEPSMRLVPTAFAMTGGALDARYADCWSTLEDRFTP